MPKGSVALVIDVAAGSRSRVRSSAGVALEVISCVAGEAGSGVGGAGPAAADRARERVGEQEHRRARPDRRRELADGERDSLRCCVDAAGHEPWSGQRAGERWCPHGRGGRLDEVEAVTVDRVAAGGDIGGRIDRNCAVDRGGATDSNLAVRRGGAGELERHRATRGLDQIAVDVEQHDVERTVGVGEVTGHVQVNRGDRAAIVGEATVDGAVALDRAAGCDRRTGQIGGAAITQIERARNRRQRTEHVGAASCVEVGRRPIEHHGRIEHQRRGRHSVPSKPPSAAPPPAPVL